MKRNQPVSSSRGATAVEALVAFPLFFMVILAFIDVSRYTFLVLGLRHAAQRTVDYASKIDIGADVTEAACTTDPVECIEDGCSGLICTEYQARLADMEAFAMRYADLVSDPSTTTGSSARRLRFNHYPAERYNLDSGPRNQVWSALASQWMEFAFIRPGEVVRLELAAEDNLEIQHRVRPFGTGDGQG